MSKIFKYSAYRTGRALNASDLSPLSFNAMMKHTVAESSGRIRSRMYRYEGSAADLAGLVSKHFGAVIWAMSERRFSGFIVYNGVEFHVTMAGHRWDDTETAVVICENY